MTHETGKSMLRRSGDARFATRWITGEAIDIGAGDDSLAKYQFMFPGLVSVRSWDVIDGDAELMLGVADDSFDCIHSSHCWEHMYDPYRALHNWVRICKPGGYLVIVVPDFQQYEHGLWPSRFNLDHKWAFSVSGQAEHAHHIILLNTLALLKHVDIIKLELIERGYVHGAPVFDQSLSPACEPAIEIIARKR
jgi:SAM-dependent methyltransferase